jgi:opacity protein-like surface antigen
MLPGAREAPFSRLRKDFIMNKRLLVAAATLALAGTASAQNYLVLSAGSSDHDLGCGGATVCDESGTAFKLLGGHKFSPNFALEGGYMSYGKRKASDSGLGISLNTTIDGFGIGGAFHHDFTPQWNFVARLGLAQMKAKAKATVGGATGSDSDSSAQLYAGLGVGYRLSKQMSIDAAWDTSRAKITGEKLDVSAISLGLTFSF